MALLTKVGKFALNTVTGNQAVTGVGFQPKAIIITLVPETADAADFNVSSSVSVGFGTSSSNRASIGKTQSGVTMATRQNDTKIITLISGTTTIYEADLVSLDVDGFTINITNATAATAYQVNYTAIGGADLTNAYIKEITSPGTNSSQAYTGVGFKPDAMMTLTAGNTSLASSTIAHGSIAVGYGTSATARGVASTTDTARLESTSSVLLNTDGSAVNMQADLTTMDSDGFTLNWSNGAISGMYAWVLCLKGGSYQAGSDTQKTSTGTKAVTGLGFQPTGLLVASIGNTAGAAIDTSTGILLVGSASGTANRGFVWVGENVTAPSQSRAEVTNNLIASYVPSNTSLAATTVADLSSFDSGGFTLNWTTADATAREYIYLAMGSAPVQGPVVGPIRPGKTWLKKFRRHQTIILPSASASVARTFTQSATSRIATNRTASQPAIARVARNFTNAQPAIARIATKPTLSQGAIARVATNKTFTQSSIANIATNRGYTEPAIARIANNRTLAQGAISRIANARTLSQVAVSRISNNRSLTQGATAHIIAIVTKTQTATARIVQPVSKTQTVTAHIIQAVNKIQPATAHIAATVTKTQGATARIAKAGLGVNLITNGFFDNLPTITADQTTNNKWLDGTAAGSATDTYHWYGRGMGSTVHAQFDTTNTHNGNNSMHYQTTTGGAVIENSGDATGYSTQNTEGFAMKEGATYRLSGWIKAANVTGSAATGAKIAVLPGNPSGAVSTWSIGGVVANQGWTYYEQDFTCPTGAGVTRGHAELRLYAQDGTGTLQGDFWFAEVRLVEVGQNQVAKARIAVNLGYTQPAIARVGVNRGYTQPVIARIALNSNKTQPATARIANSRTLNQNATARVARVITKTQTSVARIVQPLTKTQASTARVIQAVNKIQPATARIIKAISINQSSVARVSNSLTKPQSSIARIANTRSLTQTAIARLIALSAKTQPAIARIVANLTKTQPAVARIATARTLTQPSTARISKSLTKPQTAVSRLANNRTLAQSTTARISSLGTKTQPATARIALALNKTQSAKANITQGSGLHIVQTGKYADAGTATSFTFSFNGTPANGNLLVAFIGVYSSEAPLTAPTGWTLLDSQANSTETLAVYTKVAGASESNSYTWTTNGGVADHFAAGIYEITGQDSVTPINGYAKASGNTDPTTTPSVTPTVLGTLALAGIGTDAGGRTGDSVGSGWTLDQSAQPSYHGTDVAHRPSLTADTTTPISATFSGIGTSVNASFTVLINPIGYLKTQPAIARIANNLNLSQSATARIARAISRTQTATARITLPLTKTQGATAHIIQGVNKIQSATARIQRVVTATQPAKARVSNSLTKLQTAIARVSNTRTFNQAAIARIQKALTKTQSATARIIQQRSATQPATASITNASVKNQTATARIFVPNFSETFTGAIPSDITKTAGVVYVSGTLQSNGGGDLWYFNPGGRFDINGDFEFEYDLKINGTSRDIANMGFWLKTPGLTTANGWMFRLQNVGADGGFFIVANGAHGSRGTAVAAIPSDTWMRVYMRAVGTVVTATVINTATGIVHSSTTYDVTPDLDATHSTSGTFGQKQDGAGTSDSWDNLYLAANPHRNSQTAIARIATKPTNTQTAKAAIVGIISKVQSATAHIISAVNKIQPAKARIQKTATLTQGAVARTAISQTKTQPAKARVASSRNNAQGAVARIVSKVIATQTATARIVHITPVRSVRVTVLEHQEATALSVRRSSTTVLKSTPHTTLGTKRPNPTIIRSGNKATPLR